MWSEGWIVLLTATMGMAGSAHLAASGPCARTPAAALLAAKSSGEAGSGRSGTEGVAEVQAESGSRGYRVGAVRWDPLLRRTWAVIESCDHRERPSMTMLTELEAPHGTALAALSSAGSALLPIVRAGDLVRLWRNESHAHIEMVATAEENGAVGSRVRVRLARPSEADGTVSQPPQYVAGVVRGPADVEMEP